MGRHKTPTALKVIEGNPSKRPIPKEPKVTGTIRMPSTLSKEAKTFWKQITGAMPKGVYLPTDAPLLVSFCEAAAMHKIASQHIAKEGAISKGSKGQDIVSPWVKIQSDNASKIASLGSKLGLTPVDRANLPTGEDDEVNPFLK